MLQFHIASFNLKFESEEKRMFGPFIVNCTSSHSIFSVCFSLAFQRSDFCIVKLIEWEPQICVPCMEFMKFQRAAIGVAHVSP